MGNGPGTMGLGLAGFIAVWTAMMAAMMLPAVAPVGALYLRTIRARATGWVRLVRTGAFLAGYIAVWAAVGILAYLAALGAERLVEDAPTAGRWAATGIVLAAGIYQLTPLKDACLAHCRSPLGLLLHVGNYRGPLRDVRAGVYPARSSNSPSRSNWPRYMTAMRWLICATVARSWAMNR